MVSVEAERHLYSSLPPLLAPNPIKPTCRQSVPARKRRTGACGQAVPPPTFRTNLPKLSQNKRRHKHSPPPQQLPGMRLPTVHHTHARIHTAAGTQLNSYMLTTIPPHPLNGPHTQKFTASAPRGNVPLLAPWFPKGQAAAASSFPPARAAALWWPPAAQPPAAALLAPPPSAPAAGEGTPAHCSRAGPRENGFPKVSVKQLR